MPKGYWVTTYRSIKDPDKLAAYAKLAPVALAPFGAKYIVRGAAVAASEDGIKQRVVISVFDNVSQAIAAHDSPAYQAAVKVSWATAPNATCVLSKGWNRVLVNYARHLLHCTEISE